MVYLMNGWVPTALFRFQKQMYLSVTAAKIFICLCGEYEEDVLLT